MHLHTAMKRIMAMVRCAMIAATTVTGSGGSVKLVPMTIAIVATPLRHICESINFCSSEHLASLECAFDTVFGSTRWYVDTSHVFSMGAANSSKRSRMI